MQGTEVFLVENFPYLFLAYVVIYHGAIPLAKAFMQQYLPVKLTSMRNAEERRLEVEERRADIAEREVVAMEQIGKTLVIIEVNQRHMESALQVISESCNTANNALSKLLVAQDLTDRKE